MILKTDRLSTGYKEMEIVHEVSIELFEKEIVTIIGPNGAGKSTLLKAIFGLLPVFNGSVIAFGNNITGKSPASIVRTGLGFVPQSHNTFPGMTVRENLEMGGFNRKDSIEKSIDEMYSLFPVLHEKSKLRAGNLSGGEQQMVAFARALMAHPKVLLLDEPTAGLAPKLAKELFDKVKEIRDKGIAILMVEQNVKTALAISDRAYIFVTGRKKHEGPAHEFMNDEDLKRHYFGD